MLVALRFLPSTCPEQCPVLLDEDGAIREGGFKKDLSRRLDFSVWLLAWDRYAIGVQGCIIVAYRRICIVLFYVAGAAVLKQLSFKNAMKHKAIVAEVACSAKSRGKLPILGVLFDEVSRRGCLHCYLACFSGVCMSPCQEILGG